jgi:hypothetical protein
LPSFSHCCGCWLLLVPCRRRLLVVPAPHHVWILPKPASMETAGARHHA